MVRVLHVIKSLVSGGIETMIMNFYRNIDREKVQFDFAVHTQEYGFYEAEARKLGARIYYFHNLNEVNVFEYKREWEQFWKEHMNEYVVVHGHYRSHATFYVSVAKKWGVKTIAHSHSTSPKTIRGLGISMLMYPLRYSADYLFACSQKAGIYMFGRQFYRRGEIINNAIDIQKFKIDKRTKEKLVKQYSLENKFIVGHVGNYLIAKNHEFLIDIFVEIRKMVPNSKLVLIGAGTDDKGNELWKKISKLDLEGDVIALGKTNQVSEWLQVMNAFVFPSIHEGLGMAVVEAQAAGVRCVISDTIPNEVLVSNEIMQKSINTSAKEWAECVMDFCGNYVKVDTKKEISKHGYDITTECKRLQEFYIGLGEKNE